VTIEVLAVDFARTNRGLIIVLKAIQKAGDDGISTRKLLRKIGMIGYGEQLSSALNHRVTLKEKSASLTMVGGSILSTIF
jgi:hypothetical protein